MKKIYAMIICTILLASCASVNSDYVGSYSARGSGSYTLDLGHNGDAYWQRVRKDGSIEIREGVWSASGSTIYLNITSQAVMKGRREMHKGNVDKDFSGTVSGNCIRLKSKKYCK
ncbi:hypothetical protein [Candidatus Uabimicrobium sp. HlEnr_7]|uniref:hypothetical protein n=1 Tax=Candidatus Uabimicrobium helgolandensis TaxID=3095367 RepID=UPI00355708C5